MLKFRRIDLTKDRETIISFRKDSYAVSFGNTDGFGDADAYLGRIEDRIARFPDGLMLAEENGKTVGQIELQIISSEGREIGYVNLLYLIPAYRGKGVGRQLMEYAERFFRRSGVDEYRLRVAPNNERAVKFYTKCGLRKLKEEQSPYLVWILGKKM